MFKLNSEYRRVFFMYTHVLKNFVFLLGNLIYISERSLVHQKLWLCFSYLSIFAVSKRKSFVFLVFA